MWERGRDNLDEQTDRWLSRFRSAEQSAHIRLLQGVTKGAQQQYIGGIQKQHILLHPLCKGIEM